MSNKATTTKPFGFSGSIPGHYDQYMGPMFFEPYAVEVAKRVDPTSVKVALELASGTGRVTRHLRHVLPYGARLIASDISPDMLTVAKEKLAGQSIDWQIIDAQELPLQDESVDLVVCCFGLMFVEDKLKVCSEAHRVLRRGGMFLLATWDKLETIGASQVYREIAKKYLVDPLPESYNLPFSMHDVSVLNQLLEGAGFSKISIEKVGKESKSPSAKDAAEGMTHGGTIYNEIMSRNPAWVIEIKALVEEKLAEKFGPAPMIAPMSAVISEAWK